MNDGEENEGSDTPPGFQVGGGATAHIVDCHFENCDVEFKEDTHATIIDSSVSGSVEMTGNTAHIDGFEISGSGDNSAMELTDVQATIFNLRINPGYRYGLTAQDSAFTIDDSVIRGNKYDLRFRSGVLADISNLEADEIFDYVRGEEHRVKQELVTISTKEEHIELEKKISLFTSLVSYYLYLNGLLDVLT